MTDRTFVFSFNVNDRFVTDQPEAAAELVEKQMAAIADRPTVRGPRGGTYRLVTPPNDWRVSNEIGGAWLRGETTYATRRMGRYVRPSRAPIPLPSVSFETLTMPVVDGAVTLPNGERIQTDSQLVTVPVEIIG